MESAKALRQEAVLCPQAREGGHWGWRGDTGPVAAVSALAAMPRESGRILIEVRPGAETCCSASDVQLAFHSGTQLLSIPRL